MQYVMAIDAGTGSGRAIVYGTDGSIAGLAQEEWSHPAAPGVPSGLDFDTAANGPLIDRVIAGALAKAGISASDLKAVSTTSMREGIVLYDAEGTPLWACPNVDARAQAEAQELTDAGIADRVFAIAGDWVSITSPARLLWIRKHRPEVAERARHLGLISDWLATRLTGEYFTEPSAGSSTALFDVANRCWSEELLGLIGIDASIFPPVVEAGTVIGHVTPEAAARSGLAAGTPVVAGGGDTQLALVGLGRKAGDATLVGGSFWQMTMLADTPIFDPARGPRTLCHARAGEWLTEGIGFLTGFSFRWLRDAFFEPLRHPSDPTSSFARMEAMAGALPPGSGGVYATLANIMQSDGWIHPAPGFTGFDFNRPEIGIGAMARSVMEAGAFVADLHLKTLESLSGRRFDRVQFTGGSSQGTLWPQIVADVIGRPLDIPVVKETTALGCAMLAAVGGGVFPGLDAAVAAMASPIERTVEPDPAVTERYAEIEARWSTVNRAMTDLALDGAVEPLWRPAGALINRR